MTFSACPSQRPQYIERAAARHAADYRRRGFPDAKGFICPFDGAGPHWHVATKADDELLLRSQAQTTERRRRYDETLAARSQAMVDGQRAGGGGPA